MSNGAPIAVRVLAVLASICVVGAFALALLFPPTLQLARLISIIDHNILLALQDGIRDHFSEWAWRALVMPLLARPSWLVPLALGMILGGAALTVASRRRVPGTPRWKN